jgi:hypothetical protein
MTCLTPAVGVLGGCVGVGVADVGYADDCDASAEAADAASVLFVTLNISG